MFETKVYKECYPFCKEVLYDNEKKKLFLRLLHQRDIDLMTMWETASKQKRKARLYMEENIQNESAILKEILNYIQTNSLEKINENYHDYLNWLIKRYKIKIFSECFIAPIRTWNRNLIKSKNNSFMNL